jgi:mannosyltransferase OCH1-like enzyme
MNILKNTKNQNLKLSTYNLKIINEPYPFFKSTYNSIIPLNIFQTWNTKELPIKMRERVELLKSQNPKFNHYLYDDNDCRIFLKKHFKPEVLNAYNSLIPGAYKADLWRLCILFIYGGIYLDIKLVGVNGFKLIELTEKEHFVLDRLPNSIFNSLMVCKKGNLFLLKAIYQIIHNIKNNYYGKTALSPTGPEMLGNVAIKNNIPINVDLIHYMNGGFILYKNRFVFSTEYPEYSEERNNSYTINNTERYDQLWLKKKIYRTSIY